ncbi:MAG: HlyD family secretion protein [Pseudomonadota bacterium]|nr:HlyD family secretion protein [Pseudomonadota bacterium]
MLEADFSDLDFHEVEVSQASRPKPTPPASRATPAAPSPPEPARPAAAPQAEDNRRFWRRRPLLTVCLVVGTALAIGAGYLWWDASSHYESTDDAFIAARQSAIAPKITGYVKSVSVTDNQHVEAGDVIATLDDRDYQVALDSADAQLASAKAGLANAQAQLDVQNAQIEAARAQVDQAKAALAFARQQASRYRDLAQKGAGSVQNAQQYSSQLDQQDAAVKSAEAAENVTERQLEALKAQLLNARANVSVARAQRDAAALNLSYATLRASEPGRIVNLTAAPGELAQPGADLAMFVPDEIWITANFKETQLDRMRPGQPVGVSIDAYPDRAWRGHVDSVQPGSGTAFSLLPAENATGNYVKVVQRVPVKVVLDGRPADVALGPGMSVEPSVRVDPTPSLWERLVGEVRLWRKS